jgi:hypothetical protein
MARIGKSWHDSAMRFTKLVHWSSELKEPTWEGLQFLGRGASSSAANVLVGDFNEYGVLRQAGQQKPE